MNGSDKFAPWPEHELDHDHDAVLLALQHGWQPNPEQPPHWDTADAWIHAEFTEALDGATDEVAAGLRTLAEHAVTWLNDRAPEHGFTVLLASRDDSSTRSAGRLT